MKSFIFCLLIISTHFFSFSQGYVIEDELPDCYTYTYFIWDDYGSAKFWDKATDDDAQGYSPFHGGANQIWYVMPTYPKSIEVMFINTKEGKILDRSLNISPNNLYCYSGRHTGGENQLFYLTEKESGSFPSYAIECADVYKVIDRSLSSNTLFCNATVHYGQNQKFHFDNYQRIPNSDKLDIYNLEDGIQLPPQPTSLTDPGTSESVKHNYALVSETIIPFPYVLENGRSWSWQAANSPYYRLEKHEYYKLVDPISVGYGLNYEITSSETIGLTTSERTSISNTMGIELTINGEVTIGLDNLLGQKVAANLKTIFQKNTTTEYKEENLSQKTDIAKFSKQAMEAQRIFCYRLVEEYKLYRMNADYPVDEWDITTDKRRLFLSYPHSDIKEGSTLKNGSTHTTTFTQSESTDLIPRMFSNTSPSGIASASSSYSSYYYPWKAFDGEDESGSWSRWISIPTGTFNGQWLSYEFSEPVTIMAYGITPETGTHINRSPQDWKVQAWNGSSWITLDTRTGYTTSSWQDSNSQKFTVKYPKKYNKYRLYVEKVNGSDVVSIRKFKIFGLKNDGTVKSGKSSGSLPFEITKSTPSSEIKISPNPNKGAFTVDLINVEESLEIEPFKLDSLSIVNELRKGLSFTEITTPPIAIIEIYNPMGQKIFSSETKERRVEVRIDDPKHGIYIVKAILANKEIITEKIMINK